MSVTVDVVLCFRAGRPERDRALETTRSPLGLCDACQHVVWVPPGAEAVQANRRLCEKCAWAALRERAVDA